MRGESVRRLKLAVTFILDLDNEDPTECQAMIAIMEQGETDQFAQIELGACIWNKYCAICPLGAVVFHFFTHWCLDLECQPSLTTSQEWFNLKFATCRRGTFKETTYNSHLVTMMQCLGFLRMGCNCSLRSATGQTLYLG
jgi:Centromere DNA-binding protein complex CBF3 subunit, domain 2